MKARYILLPEGGIRGIPEVKRLLRSTHTRASMRQPLELPGVTGTAFSMLDSVAEDGPKLVELDRETADAINRSSVPLRARPEVIYPHPAPRRPAPAAPLPPGAGTTFVVQCTDAQSGQRVPQQEVFAFDDANGTEATGTTNAQGEVRLQLATNTIDRLYILAGTHWGTYQTSVAVQPRIQVILEPVLTTHSDAIRLLYPMRRFVPGAGVTVGVLDTGVGPHADLNLLGGRCTVMGQPPGSFAGIDDHETHVAGLIGGRGGIGPVTLGLAPGVALRSYRVFGLANGKITGSNFAVLKAMIHAAMDGCDILNLSLGGAGYDDIVLDSVLDARDQGMLVLCASGNSGRQNVEFPAAYPGATAVSAMGSDRGFPGGCVFTEEILRPPYGANQDEYIASFSNVGPATACTGLGSGVTSTLLNNRFGPMSGTSMATPMVAGGAASLLSQQPAILAMARTRARSDAIERLLQTSCVQRFGGGGWEGHGLPDPASI